MSVPIHTVPITRSDERAHVLDADCWCEPTVVDYEVEHE